MTNKLLIAKTGFNALSETDPDNFIFHSDYDTLKYETQGIITVTTNLSNYYHFEPGGFPFFDTYYHRTVGEVTHGLGYIPYFVGYLLDVLNPDFVGPNASQSPWAFGDAGIFANISVFADSNKLYFLVQFNSTNNSGTIDVDLSYRIFKNELNI